MNLARVTATSGGLNRILWAGSLAGPVAWFTQLEAVYALAPGYCGPRGRLGLHLVSLLCLTVATAGGCVTCNEWVVAGHAGASRSDEALAGRARFMAALGFLACLLCVLLILAQWIAICLLDPCPL
jgi:hypothetical protein